MIKRFFAILIMFSFMLPVVAEDGHEADGALNNQEAVETISNEESDDLNINSQETYSDVIAPQADIPTKYKEPISKRKLAKKFIIAMLCVAGTSVFLYGTLSFYNRLKEGFSADYMNTDEETPLDTPQDISEAVKSFIDKTRW